MSCLSNVRFQDRGGRLQAAEVQRSCSRPLVSAFHGALVALGVVVTSYQVQATPEGLQERFEFASSDGEELDSESSDRVRSALIPLALEGG